MKAIATLLIFAATLLAQEGSVRVTATLANIRQQPSETAPVITQVKKDALLQFISAEGDWFKIRIPMGALRVDAYISKKVSKLETAAGSPATDAKPKVDAVPVRDGMSVALVDDQNLRWLQPATARVIQLGDKVDSIAKNGANVPAGDALPANASASSTITYVWIADGAAATRVIDSKKPSFYVGYKEVPGFSGDDLAPVIVRLTPATSGVRVIASVRGRVDQASRTDADWDVMKDLKQDIVKAEVDLAERGVAKLTATSDLAPGQYAIVLRPTTKKKLSGSNVLRTVAEARLFTAIWDFTVK